MGVLSFIKKTYTNIDRRIGGFLPGGAPRNTSPSQPSSPSQSTSSPSSSPTSSSTSTAPVKRTTSSGGGGSSQVTQIPQKNVGGVVVTDYNTGESVTTQFDSSGKIIKQTYASGGSRSGNLIGQSQTIETANEPGGLVYASTARSTPVTSSNGQTLQPGSSSIAAASYTGEPPQRYQRPLGSALGESFRNFFNFGVVGRQGVKAYVDQAFFQPFEYVGRPKYFSEATEVRGYAPKDFLNPRTERNFLYPTGQTYYGIAEERNRETFSKVNVPYTGQPIETLGNQIPSQVKRELEPGYQAELQKGTDALYKSYQDRVNRGDLTVEEARKGFAFDAGQLAERVNTRFNAEVYKVSKERYSLVSSDISSIVAFRREIFEPPAYSKIRRGAKVAEIGGVVAATSFGGSIPTFIASGYLATRTANEAINFGTVSAQLTPTQRVIGGASILAGGLGAAYTFNLGVSKFYREWRGIIYDDLARTPGKIQGREVLKTGKLTSYEVYTFRSRGADSSITRTDLDVYNTGTNRIDYFSRGATITRIVDPETNSFVTSTTQFRNIGYVPNIAERAVDFGSRGVRAGVDGFYTGKGQAFYSSGTTVKSYEFIGGAKDQGDLIGVFGGRNPQIINSNTPGFRYGIVEGTTRASLDSSGSIYKLPSSNEVTYIIGSGAKSSPAYIQSLYSGGVATSTASDAQRFALNELSAQSVRGVSGGASLFSGASAAASTQIYRATTIPTAGATLPAQQARVAPVLLPSLQQLGLTSQRSVAVSFASTSPASGTALRQPLAQVTVPIQLPRSALLQTPSSALRFGLLVPPIGGGAGGGYVALQPGGSFILPPFGLNPGGFDLGSNIIRGGRSVVGYSPSYSALFFNIRGSAPRSSLPTGFNLRPITPGFKFNTGLDSSVFRSFGGFF